MVILKPRGKAARFCAALAIPVLLAVSMPPILEHASYFRSLSKTENSPVSVPAVDHEAPRKQALADYLANLYKKEPETIREYVDLAYQESKKHPDVSAELVLAVMGTESSLNPSAESAYGAKSLMQVVPRIHRDKLKGNETFDDINANIRVGTEILQEYLSKTKGDLSKALKKYSGNATGYSDKVKRLKSQLEDI